jgi:hypothetical protein
MCGVVKPCRVECGPTDLVYQVRLSAKRISTRQYARLVDERAPAISRRRENYGTHSLRPTKAISRRRQETYGPCSFCQFIPRSEESDTSWSFPGIATG